jgi:hypothetical protein
MREKSTEEGEREGGVGGKGRGKREREREREREGGAAGKVGRGYLLFRFRMFSFIFF